MEGKNQALDDIKTIKEVMEKTARLVRSSAPILIMWGFIIMIGYGLAPVMKEKTGLFWTIAGPLGGIISAIIGIRQDLTVGKVESWIGKRLAIFWTSWLVINYVLFSSVVRPETAPYHNEIGLFWSMVAAIGFIATGLLISLEITLAGLVIAASALFGWFVVPQYFFYIVGFVSGGALITIGLYEIGKKK